MSIRMKFAFSCHLLAAIMLAAIGSLYLLRSKFMPYHAEAAGMKWHEMVAPLQILLLSLMHVLGGTQLAAAGRHDDYALPPF